MIQQEIEPRVLLLPHADLDGVRHFQERMQIAKLAQPDNQVIVKMLVAHRPDVNCLAEAEGVHRDGR